MVYPRRYLSLLLLVIAFLPAACGPEEIRKPVDGDRPDQEASRASAEEIPDQKPNAEVVGVNDGDTITVRVNGTGRQEKVRLATIDAPELNQPFGQAAKKSLSDLVFGKQVRLEEVDRDRYGRMVAEVFIGPMNVNLEQIRRGFAWHYKEYRRQQTPEMRAAYSTAEAMARQGQAGLWRGQNPEPPWSWRKGNRRVD